MHGACLRDAQKLIETRVRLVPAFLSLFRQRKEAKKTTPAAAPSLWLGSLRFSKTGAALNLRQLRCRFEHAGRTSPRFSAMLGTANGAAKRLSANVRTLFTD